jgi:hypothetical protein
VNAPFVQDGENAGELLSAFGGGWLAWHSRKLRK